MTFLVSARGDSFLQFLTVLVIFILVLAITVYTTKWIANYQKGQGAGKNIEVIESNRVGQNKLIEIVRIGDKYVAIGLGKDEITMLTELDKSQITIPEQGSNGVMSFKEIFEKKKIKSDQEKVGDIDE